MTIKIQILKVTWMKKMKVTEKRRTLLMKNGWKNVLGDSCP
jgi:hypothetical protein